MAHKYEGPVRDEPPAVELYNTLYVFGGQAIDGLADRDGLNQWLAALGPRLPVAAKEVDTRRLGEFVGLRAAVRDALDAVSSGRRVPAAATRALNAAAARDPHSLELTGAGAAVHHHGGNATDVALAALASDAIALVAGPQATKLHACGAPSCVLMFLGTDRRRDWCSTACGNRARQARHYARVRDANI
jgi:predicted RNA-binding Zn ribbon-like protein